MDKLNSMQIILKVFGIDENTRPIGRGNYSRAYLTKRGTILKFTIDEAYMAYINAVTASPNELEPEILNNFGEVAKVLCEDFDGCTDVLKEVPLFAVELPKYKHIYISENVPNIDNLRCVMERLEDFCSYGFYFDNKSLQKDFAPIVRSGLDAYQMFDFVNLVRKLQHDLNAFNDMHSENFMWDDVNNRLVVTDPIGSRTHQHSLNSVTTKASIGDVYSCLNVDKVTQIGNIVGDSKIDTLLVKFAGSLSKDKIANGKRADSFNIKVVKSPKFHRVRRKVLKECAKNGMNKNSIVSKLLDLGWDSTNEIRVEIRKQRDILGLPSKGDDE